MSGRNYKKDFIKVHFKRRGQVLAFSFIEMWAAFSENSQKKQSFTEKFFSYVHWPFIFAVHSGVFPFNFVPICSAAPGLKTITHGLNWELLKSSLWRRCQPPRGRPRWASAACRGHADHSAPCSLHPRARRLCQPHWSCQLSHGWVRIAMTSGFSSRDFMFFKMFSASVKLTWAELPACSWKAWVRVETWN